MTNIATLLISFSFLLQSGQLFGKSKFSFFEEHQNKGCPINSHCSKNSGLKRMKWETLIEKITPKNHVERLNKFLKSDGLPIQFLAKTKEKFTFDPILWNSRCDFHNPKNPNNDVLRGESFLKSLSSPNEKIFTPVQVYNGTEKTTYHLPYQDQLILIKNNKLLILKEYDDFYYQISIGPDGSIEVVNHPMTLIKMALTRKVSEFKCPTVMNYDKRYFSKAYCQKVLDLDTNDLKIVQFAWSCP
jgi:hypothetical protein